MRPRRKIFLTLLIIAAIVFGITRFLSPDAIPWSLATAGFVKFFQDTLPQYVRSKLTIPENPVVKRERILDELTANIEAVERELAVASPGVSGGSGGGSTGGALGAAGPRQDSRSSGGGSGAGVGSGTNQDGGGARPNSAGASPGGQASQAGGASIDELRERIERTQELLAKSEAAIEDLRRANPELGFLAKAAERALDKILPAPPGGGPGGASGTVVCEKH